MGVAIPNTFIVGAPKCGTTALYEYLRTHPQIHFSRRKEPRYWCTDLEVRKNRSSQRLTSLDDYLQLFQDVPETASVVAEASTLYLRSEVAIPDVLKFHPAAKFIVMVRDPIDMFHSWHNYLVNQFIEDVREPETAWRLQGERSQGRNVPEGCDISEKLQYRKMISLGEQVARFQEIVPDDQRLIILNEDLAVDPAEQYGRVLEFLNVDHDGREEFPRANQAADYRARWLAKTIHDPPRWLVSTASWLRRRVPGAFSPGMRSGLLDRLRRRRDKTDLSSEFRRELAAEVVEDVALLSQLLGRDLRHWAQPVPDGQPSKRSGGR